MIVLFTDFGLEGPYIGQVEAVLRQQAPGVPVVNLFADLAPFDIQGAAYLLPAYTAGFDKGTVFLCVVDPGVGSERPGVVINADGCWYVGPDEGLFELVIRRARSVECHILPTVDEAAPSFHGRDVFAPAAAFIARNTRLPDGCGPCEPSRGKGWPDDLSRVLYIDRFGNAITGLRAAAVAESAILTVAGQELKRATTFSDVAAGEAFWYENSSGLVEVAVNQGRADTVLGIAVGAAIEI